MDWIKCSERMPSYDQQVIIFTAGGLTKEAYLRRWNHLLTHKDVIAFEDETGDVFTYYPQDVTHWQPLPPPPAD